VDVALAVNFLYFSLLNKFQMFINIDRPFTIVIVNLILIVSFHISILYSLIPLRTFLCCQYKKSFYFWRNFSDNKWCQTINLYSSGICTRFRYCSPFDSFY